MTDAPDEDEIIKEEQESPPAEVEDFEQKYIRSLADMENMRKRMQKERGDMTRFAVENIISEFLPALDNFEGALGHSSHMSEETQNWAKGFEMILSQFKDVLESHGIFAFRSKGMKFDPHLHEAMEMEETEEIAEGTIIKELVRGYKRGDRVLRAARVTVAKAPAKERQEEEVSNTTNEE